MMKKIILPHISALDAHNLCSVADTVREKGAVAQIDCSPWQQAYPAHAGAVLHAAHDGSRLYFLFDCTTAEIRAENTAEQSAVSDDSCVEAFIRPVDGGEYWNFEVNCLGAINASHRIDKPHAVKLTHDELGQVWRLRQSFASSQGAAAWSQLISVPLSLIGCSYEPGMCMRANFYACAAKARQPYFLCWNAIESDKPNYHLPEFFGTVELQ